MTLKNTCCLVSLFGLALAAGCGKSLQHAKTVSVPDNSTYKRLAEQISAGHKYLSNKKVAVLPFSYTDKRASNDGTVIAEKLLTLILNKRELEVIERGLLDQVLAELKLQNSGAISENSLKSLGKILGVEAIVAGTLTRRSDGTIEINARLIKTEGAEVVSAASAVVLPDWDSSVASRPAMTGRPMRNATGLENCPSGPVAYWSLNNDAEDTSAPGYLGRLVGGPAWTAGKVGQALDLDGKDDYVETTFNPTVLGQNFTVSAWVYPRSEGNHNGVAGGHGVNGMNGFTFLQYNKTGWACVHGDGNGWSPENRVPLTLNAWNHVACVWAAGEGTKVFVDGVLPSPANDMPQTRYVQHVDYFWIGRAYITKDRLFNGLIDELAVYDRALTAAEIRKQYEGGLNGKGPCSL